MKRSGYAERFADARLRVPSLPKWAQEYIEALDRQAVQAIRALEAHNAVDTISAFSYEKRITIEGRHETSRLYVPTDRIDVEFAGVSLSVYCRPEWNNARQDQLDVSYSGIGNRLSEPTMLQPTSLQAFSLWSLK